MSSNVTLLQDHYDGSFGSVVAVLPLKPPSCADSDFRAVSVPRSEAKAAQRCFAGGSSLSPSLPASWMVSFPMFG